MTLHISLGSDEAGDLLTERGVSPASSLRGGGTTAESGTPQPLLSSRALVATGSATERLQQRLRNREAEKSKTDRAQLPHSENPTTAASPAPGSPASLRSGGTEVGAAPAQQQLAFAGSATERLQQRLREKKEENKLRTGRSHPDPKIAAAAAASKIAAAAVGAPTLQNRPDLRASIDEAWEEAGDADILEPRLVGGGRFAAAERRHEAAPEQPGAPGDGAG